jgi:urease accessory protein
MGRATSSSARQKTLTHRRDASGAGVPDRTTGISEPTAGVGRVGLLALEYVRRDSATILTHSRSTAPWHLTPPIILDEPGCLYQPLVNPSGGLVGGDRLSIHLTLGPRAHVVISTPSANRVYRSLGDPALQIAELTLSAGAILEWVPDVTILFGGSRFRQRITVRLEPGATMLLWDAVASGRIARGERWAFASLENEIRITTAEGSEVLERTRVAPGDRGRGAGLAVEWDYVASLYLVSDGVGPEMWKRLDDRLAEILERRSGVVLGGVSEPSAPGLVVKLVARAAPDLSEVFEEIWKTMRDELWKLPTPALRRY